MDTGVISSRPNHTGGASGDNTNNDAATGGVDSLDSPALVSDSGSAPSVLASTTASTSGVDDSSTSVTNSSAKHMIKSPSNSVLGKITPLNASRLQIGNIVTVHSPVSSKP